MEPVLVGAVAYTPNAVPIWEGLRDYYRGAPVEMDFVLFSNYARQVDALLAGTIDIAWNTNLAWVRTVLRTGDRASALAMRDTDLAFRSHLVCRKGAGFRNPVDLTGRRLALGSRDSAQAAILPLHYLRREGLTDGEVELLRIDSDLGKHGDTGRSELDAIRAVLDGAADAAAIGTTTWEFIGRDEGRNEGRDELMPNALESFWISPAYCHCNFTALDSLDADRAQAWTSHLLAMDWHDPEHRRILELAGLTQWVRPQLRGYNALFQAVKEQEIPAGW
ncbi:Rv1680 family SBP-like protein [Streptomyces gobiensis]|uniref:Rv1680 family SBP-like protein n=1 Tax=Streptomyces gobiensis TaxID=2875706 RepID=UPI001E4D2F78|nr:PhnD/SsuA/transferrin family substrate-binding protein [Streptomyces gobiensis]UGY91476.1 PhnD/SsuA/transferrin family substrate-binding protein [Streptomyces gobiensis]